MTLKVLYVFSAMVVIMALLLAVVDLKEFYNVAILENSSSYPFGGVNETPWYYKSASTYSCYMLVSGSSLILLSSITAYCLKRNNSKGIAISTNLLLLLVLITLVNGGLFD